MEPSKRPVWWESRESDEVLIISYDLLGCSFKEKVDVEVTSCGNVA